jgi:glycerophosphoryl diester phosphodiesterase
VTLSIAHRGDPYAHPENTLPAVLAAAGQGADMVEIDLRLTKDCEVVLLHDSTLRQVWGRDVCLSELTLDEVRTIRVRSYQVPTFAEVLSAVSAPLMVDLPESAAAVHAAELVTRHRALARCLFVTSDVEALLRIRELAPKARIGLTWAERELPGPAVLKALSAEFFNPAWEVLALHEDIIWRMHDDGYQVSTWTVDSPTNMARLLGTGVDAVVTNRLPFLVDLLGRDCAAGLPERRSVDATC